MIPNKYKSSLFRLLLCILYFISSPIFANEAERDEEHEGHKHEEHKQKKSEKPHDEMHDEQENHEEHAHGDLEESHNKGHEDGHGDQHHDEHENKQFGKNKAITKVENEGERFELSSSAEKILKIEVSEFKANAKGTFLVPASSIVNFRDESGIYIKRGDAYQLLETRSLKNQGSMVEVKPEGAGSSERVVTAGVALLRVAHLQASGEGGEGHVH
ncbi:hypothetical protein KA183_20135 [bacterium]|nr:hypothetical protein [bacterium]